MQEEKWYIVKDRPETRWIAYKVTKEQIEALPSNFGWRGPFNNLVQALMAANEEECSEC